MPLSSIPFALVESPPATLPEGKRGLCGLAVVPTPLRLRLKASPPTDAQPAKLLLVNGLDCRFDATLSFTVQGSSWQSNFDASFISVGQRVYVELPPALVSQLHAADLIVTSTGEAPLWLVSPNAQAPSVVPQLLVGSAEDPLRAALDRLLEPAYAQFGWMGGCITEALYDGWRASGDDRYHTALERWLDRYLTPDGFHFDDPRSVSVVNETGNIEASLPFAAVARLRPEHPSLEFALKTWKRLLREDGVIRDHSSTCEGSFTVAYPMMVLGTVRNDPALISLALRQITLRRAMNVYNGDIYLRSLDGGRSFRNWTRGIAWYLLGLAKTLEAAGPHAPAELKEHFAERARWIASRQRSDGLWDNFLDDPPGPPPDGSGSCGIAAALLLATQSKLLAEDYAPLATRTFAAARALLTPDGFLTSVAPNNKRGEEFQHTNRRTCEPFALGLFGMLAARAANG